MKQRRNRTAPTADAELLDAGDETAAHITRFFESIGEDQSVGVSVYQVDPKNRLKRSFLFALDSVRELSGPQLMAELLSKYGPGEYIAEGRDERNVIRFCPRFRVGPVRAARAEIPAPSTPAGSASMPPELVALFERNTRALEALAQREAPSTLDTIRELAAMRDFLAPPAAPAQPFDLSAVVGVVRDVLNLRETLGDAAGGAADGPLAVLARSLAPALTKIAERAVDAPALPRPGQPAADGATVEPAAPAGEGSMFGQGALVKGYVAELMRFAEQGVEPADAAQRIVNTLSGFPESMVAAVLDWLNDEEIVAELAKLDPRAAQYADWIVAVVDRVLDAFDDDAPAETAKPVNGAQPAAPN